MADVAAVFVSRSDFAANVEPRALFDGASRIRAAGLSLNLICQQVPDQHLRRMLTEVAQLTCLFLPASVDQAEHQVPVAAGPAAGEVPHGAPQ
jgi:hypothetical protein